MALRDIFDSDPRSKDQLREEIRVHGKVIADLSHQLHELEARASVADLTLVEPRNEIEIAHIHESAPAAPSPLLLPASVVAQPETFEQDKSTSAAGSLDRDERPANLPPTANTGTQSDENLIPDNSMVAEAAQAQLLQIQKELARSEKFKAILVFTYVLNRRLAELQLAELDQSKLEIAHLQVKLFEIPAPPPPVVTAVPTDGGYATQQKLEEQLAHALTQLERAEARLAPQRSILDALEIENVALKKGVGPEVWGLRRDIEKRDQETKRLQYELDLGILKYNAKVEELGKLASQGRGEQLKLKQRLCEMDETIASLTEAMDDAELENLELQVTVTALESEARKAASQLQLQVNKNQNLSAELARMQRAVKEKKTVTVTASRAVDQVFQREEILAWMFSETQPDDLQVDRGYLHLMGSGPWDNDAFGRLMEGQNFSLWQLPDDDISHLVIGRNNWNAEDLIAQIEARKGQSLRIYSQEMWFAAMATGRDPFDADNPELLQAFAADHDALQFLIAQEMPWPKVSDRPPGDITPMGPGEIGVLESPMHLMDYRVGKKSPHSEEERHAILNDIFSARSLMFGDDCSPTYRANWGAPKSAQRLYRMATHIKFIVDGPNGSDYRKSVAREDWINDLAWLKKTYFRKTVHTFQWPRTHVP